MKNIVLTRIDDRLIHGQVVTAWIKQYPINKILIIDDELSQNRLMERIYKAAAPIGMLGEPEYIAEAVSYVVSAEFMTGQVISPNGGLVI